MFLDDEKRLSKARNIRWKLELTRESRASNSNLEMNINNVAITFASRNRSANEVASQLAAALRENSVTVNAAALILIYY